MPPRLPVFTSAAYTVPLPKGHRFPMERYEAVAAAARARLGASADFREPPRASTEQLTRAHDAGFVRRFLGGEMSAAEARAIGFPLTRAFTRRTLAITGATVAATRAVLRGDAPAACNLAGGTHHAFRGHGEGFCPFNDIAVAALDALATGRARRALVVDLDVHQGNGTAEIFAQDPRVFTLSVHCAANYPWAEGFVQGDADVALPADVGGDEYLDAVDAALRDALRRSAPDVVFFQAGVDPLAADRLGKMSLSRADLARRNELVFSLLAPRPVVVTMGGGYARPIEESVSAHVDVVGRAAGYIGW